MEATVSKKVSEKLNVGERSITNILNNSELVERILNETPIWIEDYYKLKKLSKPFIKKLISGDLISHFQNSINQGSKIFIFENELTKYETDLNYGSISTWICIQNQTKLYLVICKKFLTDNEYKAVSMALDGYHYKAISEDLQLSRERIRQIVEKGYRKLNKYSKFLKDEEEMDEIINAKSMAIQNMNIYIDSKGEELKEEFYERTDLYKIYISDMDFDVRTYNCLRAAEIKTLGQLVQFSEKELLSFRNFGKKSILDLKYELGLRGLKLK